MLVSRMQNIGTEHSYLSFGISETRHIKEFNLRNIKIEIVALMSILLVGCGSNSTRKQAPPEDDETISFLSVSDARAKYDSLTDLTERYRQVLISQRLVAGIASNELSNALREWNDPFLDPLAKDSVRTRTWVAIEQLERALSEYAPTGKRIEVSAKPRSRSSMTPTSAKNCHIALKRQLSQFQTEQLGRWTKIGSCRNKVETSIDEWEANMESPDIAVFFQVEVGTYLGELTQVVSRYKPSHEG